MKLEKQVGLDYGIFECYVENFEFDFLDNQEY